MYNKRRLIRHATIAGIATATVLSAFWIGAPSSRSERPAPGTASESERSAVKAILEFETVAPEFGTAALPNPLDAKELTVSRGDTLMEMLVKAGIDRREAHAAITAMSDIYQPRDLKPGVVVTVSQRETDDGRILQRIDLDIDPRHSVAVHRTDTGDFAAKAIEQKLTKKPVRAGGTIHSSLYLAGQRAQLPPTVLADLIRIFSFDVDFQRDVQPGDSFDLMYQRLYDEDGTAVAEGNIVIAEMVLSGKRIRLYRHRTEDGDIDYFNENGQSVRKALILTPIDGARISSRFGRRRHPILGYTRMHRGVDFAAPRGTPIYAAGRGVVEAAGRNGGYGNYIRIRHNGTYKTAYGHMRGFANGIRRGKHVRQGQIIGYVGSTGRSTGPHLHYEVIRNGHQVNPKKLNLPSGRKLAGKELKRFLAARDVMETRYAALPVPHKTAENCGIC